MAKILRFDRSKKLRQCERLFDIVVVNLDSRRTWVLAEAFSLEYAELGARSAALCRGRPGELVTTAPTGRFRQGGLWPTAQAPIPF